MLLKFSDMTYKELYSYSIDRSYDGQWSLEEATFCIAIIARIEKIKVKKFGIVMPRKTAKAKEEEWQRIKPR